MQRRLDAILRPSRFLFEPPRELPVARSDSAHRPPSVRVLHGLGFGQDLPGAFSRVPSEHSKSRVGHDSILRRTHPKSPKFVDCHVGKCWAGVQYSCHTFAAAPPSQWRAEIGPVSLQTCAMTVIGSTVAVHAQSKDSGRVARYVA